MTGKLYLIPTGLGDNAPLEILPISIKKVIESIDTYIVENEKAARNHVTLWSKRKLISRVEKDKTLSRKLVPVECMTLPMEK